MNSSSELESNPDLLDGSQDWYPQHYCYSFPSSPFRRESYLRTGDNNVRNSSLGSFERNMYVKTFLRRGRRNRTGNFLFAKSWHQKQKLLNDFQLKMELPLVYIFKSLFQELESGTIFQWMRFATRSVIRGHYNFFLFKNCKRKKCLRVITSFLKFDFASELPCIQTSLPWTSVTSFKWGVCVCYLRPTQSTIENLFKPQKYSFPYHNAWSTYYFKTSRPFVIFLVERV